LPVLVRPNRLYLLALIFNVFIDKLIDLSMEKEMKSPKGIDFHFESLLSSSCTLDLLLSFFLP